METIGEDIKLLIVGYLTGELNPKDTIVLMQWINTSEANQEYFNRIKTSWELAGKKGEMIHFNVDKSWKHAQFEINEQTRQRNIFGNRFLRTAATWLLLIAAGSIITLVFNKKQKVEQFASKTEITAPLGAKSIVNMPDGTKVWLNAGSKLTYNAGFNVKDRVVELVGEAYFHVKTDKTKPFIVKTSDVIVRALGTRFNVKAYPDEKTITATLEEGKIDVQLATKIDQGKVVLSPNENIVFYKKGYQAPKNVQPLAASKSKKVSNDELEVQENVKTVLYTSWKEEKWIIESEPLSSLIPKLERKFNLTISFSDKELMNYRFSGSIKNETIEQIFKAMTYTAPVEYTVEKDTITLQLNQKLKDKFTKVITPKN
jgi:ferric-dicitrate binding protein FerR (iron transport regulator)